MISALAAAALTRVALLGAGSDARPAASLVHATTAALQRAPGVSVRAPAEVLAVAGPRADPAIATRASALWDAATHAYYTEHPQEAQDRLGEIAALWEGAGGAPEGERLRLTLWRAAVFLALGDRDRAVAETRAALEIEPGLEVDLNVFRPSLARLVDELRPGAPAFGEAPALDPAVERLLVSVVGHADATPDERRALDRLADAMRVDALVLVVAHGAPATDARAAIWWRGGPLLASAVASADADGEASLAEWARLAAAHGRPAGVAAIAPPSATPAPTRVPPAATTGSLAVRAVRAGLAFALRNHAVYGGPSAYGTSFAGAGPRVEATWRRGALAVDADASWTSWDLTRVSVRMPAGDSRAVSGGESVAGSAAIGVRFGRGEDAPALVAGAGPFVDALFARDVAGAAIFPSRTRAGLRVGVRGSVPVPVRGLAEPLLAEASLGADPLSTWRESPAGASGARPAAEVAPRLGLSLETRLRPSWRIRAAWTVEIDAARFHGAGRAPLDPPLYDARVRDTVHALAVSLTRAF